ncbi:MAG TPA: carotenoid oxygenase family protein, partial [Acidimicrobiales bacterium]|nr:carotenoid oxygenase family protein [Acidimicrobiales bacterium]
MPNPYLEGNFAPVTFERSVETELPTSGVVPPDLDGQLLRNGPNPVLRPGAEIEDHWFAGDGMIHAITLAQGRAARYRNRWVRTRRLAAALGTPVPGGPREPVDGPANTHVIRHGGVTL